MGYPPVWAAASRLTSFPGYVCSVEVHSTLFIIVIDKFKLFFCGAEYNNIDSKLMVVPCWTFLSDESQ